MVRHLCQAQQGYRQGRALPRREDFRAQGYIRYEAQPAIRIPARAR